MYWANSVVQDAAQKSDRHMLYVDQKHSIVLKLVKNSVPRVSTGKSRRNDTYENYCPHRRQLFLSYSDVVRPSTAVAPLFLSSSRPCPLPPLDPCDVRSHLSFTLASFWRLRWRQLLFSSLRLFRELGSLSFIMISFSDRQMSHFRPPGSYF